MKKLLLSVLLLISPICFANNKQQIDKVFLQEIKSEIIGLRTEENRTINELKKWGQIYFVSMDIMKEVCSHDIVQKYLKDISNYVFDLIIYEKRPLKKAINKAAKNSEDKKVHQLFDTISDKYLSDAIESGKISHRCNIQILSDCLVLTFGTIVLNNILQKIEATLQDSNK